MPFYSLKTSGQNIAEWSRSSSSGSLPEGRWRTSTLRHKNNSLLIREFDTCLTCFIGLAFSPMYFSSHISQPFYEFFDILTAYFFWHFATPYRCSLSLSPKQRYKRLSNSDGQSDSFAKYMNLVGGSSPL